MNAGADDDDYVRVASLDTPTEAHLLKNVLEACGLDPVVADSHFVQMYAWLTPAVGGVRVLVPGSQLASATRAIAEFRAGAFELPDCGEDPQR